MKFSISKEFEEGISVNCGDTGAEDWIIIVGNKDSFALDELVGVMRNVGLKDGLVDIWIILTESVGLKDGKY